MELTINGKTVQAEVEPDMPLLWVLRDELNLTGTKYGCGVAFCGACTVLLDGEAYRSCMLPVSATAGKTITTIEGLSENDGLTAVQKAWIARQVPQCGYCQSGMIMAVEALLKRDPDPADEVIDATITNICRCGTYQRVREAIRVAVRMKQEEQEGLLGMIDNR